MTGLEESLLRILSGHPFQLLLAVHLFAFPTFRRRGHFLPYPAAGPRDTVTVYAVFREIPAREGM